MPVYPSFMFYEPKLRTERFKSDKKGYWGWKRHKITGRPDKYKSRRKGRC